MWSITALVNIGQLNGGDLLENIVGEVDGTKCGELCCCKYWALVLLQKCFDPIMIGLHVFLRGAAVAYYQTSFFVTRNLHNFPCYCLSSSSYCQKIHFSSLFLLMSSSSAIFWGAVKVQHTNLHHLGITFAYFKWWIVAYI